MLGSLMNFDRFVAPSLIRIVYWVGIVAIVLGALATMAGSLGSLSYSPTNAMGGIVIAIIGGLVGLLVWRVACEVWIVIFSINDRLGQLVERGKV
ncbi:MAG: DUF4282 domain-containing protein [Hyphomonadaceae bacterium]|nr:DUF4282 domain-containing protein [Hyphomonadaceae bacterium]